MQQHTATYDLNGQTIKLEFNKLAQKATTSVLATLGETVVLVTVTAGNLRDDIDYFPLQVEYIEKLYAGGIIKGSRWVKREGRPNDDAILTGRLIDRSIRPLFNENYRRDVQIVVTLLSIDTENSPDILGAIATSAAVHVSSVPWEGPVGVLRIGAVTTEDGESENFIINPSDQQLEYSDFDLVVTSSKQKVLMLEAMADQVEHERLEKAIKFAKQENGKIIEFIEGIRNEIGLPKETIQEKFIDEKILQNLQKDFHSDIVKAYSMKADKEVDEQDKITEIANMFAQKYPEHEKKEIYKAIHHLVKKELKKQTIKTGERVDGRKPDDIRALSAAVSQLPRTHGTGLFQRGDTQVLSIATLGSPSLEQLIEGPEGQEVKRYIHHYNFPPYSVGETGWMGRTSRREIGHGALAEKAIIPVLPLEDEFPYTIRIVSEVMTSNGSTSMASTCGSTLALMDAGVPIKAPVAGIAMGILTESDEEYVVLTDIQGIEDHAGEMDFKVTGTEKGVTAIQLDVKNKGLTDAMISDTMEKAKIARLKILKVMNATIAEPRKNLSKFAPKIEIIQLQQDQIGTVIGPGGKMIRSIIAKTGADVNIDDEGLATISGVGEQSVDDAVKMIEALTKTVDVGEVYEGEVKRILPFGAFVEVLPGKEGLVHVSKMSSKFIKDPREVVNIGDTVTVKVIQIDSQGRINLQLLSTPENKAFKQENS